MPIHLASYFGNMTMVRALVKMGSTPTLNMEGEVSRLTALMNYPKIFTFNPPD